MENKSIDDIVMRLLVPGRVVRLKDTDTVGIVIGFNIAVPKSQSYVQIAWDVTSTTDSWSIIGTYDRISFIGVARYLEGKNENLSSLEFTDVILPYNECQEAVRVFGYFSEHQEKRKNIVKEIKNKIKIVKGDE